MAGSVCAEREREGGRRIKRGRKGEGHVPGMTAADLILNSSLPPLYVPEPGCVCTLCICRGRASQSRQSIQSVGGQHTSEKRQRRVARHVHPPTYIHTHTHTHPSTPAGPAAQPSTHTQDGIDSLCADTVSFQGAMVMAMRLPPRSLWLVWCGVVSGIGRSARYVYTYKHTYITANPISFVWRFAPLTGSCSGRRSSRTRSRRPCPPLLGGVVVRVGGLMSV
jgi:hypothetical protein